ncbi:MAG TPA: Mth938-like domain-containing protein [Burkholderiales bacterium]|nr:Mth938-like domain-containing protein [Burkholderiales bacterium]
MKLHPSQASTRNTFTGYGPGYVSVNGVRHEASLAVMPGKIVEGWNVANVDFLTARDLTDLAALNPEMILLGTGETLRFPATHVLAELAAAGIGVEIMDTRAACRTYNILSEEGRNVAACLILEKP